MIDRHRSQHYNTSKVVITPSSQLTNAKQLSYNNKTLTLRAEGRGEGDPKAYVVREVA